MVPFLVGEFLVLHHCGARIESRSPAGNENIRQSCVRQSHLEVPLEFPHETIDFEVIKS